MALPNYYNEMYSEDGSVRPQYAAFAEWLRETPATRIAQNRQAADLLFHRVGITFAVYGEASGTERLIPFDIVPHVISGADWDRLARGLRQRVEALNRFLHDPTERLRSLPDETRTKIVQQIVAGLQGGAD